MAYSYLPDCLYENSHGHNRNLCRFHITQILFIIQITVFVYYVSANSSAQLEWLYLAALNFYQEL